MRFLAELFPEPCHVRIKVVDAHRNWHSWLEKVPSFDAFWNFLSLKPADTYFGVAARDKDGVPVWAGAAWVDLDGVNSVDFVLPPTWIVYSGYGVHGYWMFREPEDVNNACAISRHLSRAMDGDQVHDSERVLRLPGTYNCKNSKPVPVFARKVCDRQYNQDDFPFDWSVDVSDDSQKTRFTGAVGVISEVPAALSGIVKAWVSGYRHYLSLYLSAYMAKLGFSLEAIEEFFGKICRAAGDEEFEKRKATVRSTFTKVRRGQSVEGMGGLNRLLTESVPEKARVGMFLALGELKKRAQELRGV